MSSRNSEFKKLGKKLDSVNSNWQNNNNNNGTGNSSVLSYENNQRINEIYELCIKKNLEEQAYGFYESFVVEELKPSLIISFIKMDQFKREGRYEEFCLAIYQQIETIVDYYFEEGFIKKFVMSNLSNKACVSYNTQTGVYDQSNGEITISSLIFYRDDLSWTAAAKFKAILYVKHFNYQVVNNAFLFFKKFNIEREIYSVRNLVHPGKSPYENQKKMSDLSITNKNKNYLKYIGFLEYFVSGINNHHTAQIL